jgi:hypothetical protein
MTELFVTAGIVCLVGAVVGGGLKLFGAELPFVTLGRQVLLGVLGVGLLLFGILRDDAGSGDGSTTKPPSPSVTATVSGTPPSPTPSGEDQVSEGPWSGTSDGLTLEVARVVRKADGTLEIDASVDNQTGESVTLPLFGYFVAGDDLGTSYGADLSSSQWTGMFATGHKGSGTIRLSQPINPDATALYVGFTQVFGSPDVQTIEVNGIVLP